MCAPKAMPYAMDTAIIPLFKLALMESCVPMDMDYVVVDVISAPLNVVLMNMCALKDLDFVALNVTIPLFKLVSLQELFKS